jgi:hypothetical protein
MSRLFFGMLGVVLAIIAAHAAQAWDVADTVYCCFGSYLCYDFTKRV